MIDYTYEKYLETVYGALRTLTDDEKDCVLSNLNPREIFALLATDKKENVDEFINGLKRMFQVYFRYHNAMCKLLGIEPLKNKTITEQYKELNEKDRFDTALALMNEPSFQKDCSKILINDYKRIAKSDPTIRALEKVLNVGGHLENLLQQGIGSDHKYEIE